MNGLQVCRYRNLNTFYYKNNGRSVQRNSSMKIQIIFRSFKSCNSKPLLERVALRRRQSQNQTHYRNQAQNRYRSQIRNCRFSFDRNEDQ